MVGVSANLTVGRFSRSLLALCTEPPELRRSRGGKPAATADWAAWAKGLMKGDAGGTRAAGGGGGALLGLGKLVKEPMLRFDFECGTLASGAWPSETKGLPGSCWGGGVGASKELSPLKEGKAFELKFGPCNDREDGGHTPTSASVSRPFWDLPMPAASAPCKKGSLGSAPDCCWCEAS